VLNFIFTLTFVGLRLLESLPGGYSPGGLQSEYRATYCRRTCAIRSAWEGDLATLSVGVV